MPTRELLSPAQRAQFLSLPAEMGEQMLARYYALSSEDLTRIRLMADFGESEIDELLGSLL